MSALLELLEGVRALRAHPLRTLSTVLGVAWGAFAILGLGAFGHGLEESMAARAQGMGAGIVVAWPGRTTRPWRGVPEGRVLRLEAADVRALRALPGAELVSPEFARNEAVHRGERVFRPQVTGVDPSYGALRNLVPEPGGRFLSPLDLEQARRVVVLGDRVARQLFDGREAVGRTLELAGAPYTVVGVARPKEQDSDYGALDEARVFVPASTFEAQFGARWVNNFVLRARRPEELPALIEATYATLARRLAFDPKDAQALNLWDTTEGDRIREQAFDALGLSMLLAGAFTVLVGAIGVGNLMFLAVRARTGELGLRLALGARPRAVLCGVLGEALALVAVGGALGAAAAIGLAELVALTPLTENLGVPRVSAAQGLALCALLCAVGVGAGWVPARRAARLDPVRALEEAA